MEALKALALHVKSRLAELEAEKKKGTKIVGYLPGGYLPEEFILAAGALPLGMIRSADEMTVQKSLEYLCRWFDPFYRGQIGYLTTNDDPYYSILNNFSHDEDIYGGKYRPAGPYARIGSL